MNRTLLKSEATLATASLGLSGLTMATDAGATTTRSTYYACSANGMLSNISVLSHSCAKGYKAVKGKFASTDFSNDNFAKANLTGADMSKSILAGVTSGNIVGTPAALPGGWHLVNGYLVGASAVLAHANLANANLSHLNLTLSLIHI